MLMRIIKGTITLIILITILIIGGCGGVGQSNDENIDTSLQDVKDEGYFVLGMQQEIPPLIYVDRSGALNGFDLDIMKEVAARMDLELHVEDLKGKDAMLEFKEGNVDVLVQDYFLQDQQSEQESNEAFNLSKPYVQSQYVIMTRKNSNVSSIEALKEKKVGINSKSNSQNVMNRDNAFDNIKNTLDLSAFDTDQDVLAALGVGNLDAAIVDETFARYMILQKPSEFNLIGKLEEKVLRSIVFRLDDKAFKQEIDKILEEMKQDGTIESFSKEWFGYNLMIQ